MLRYSEEDLFRAKLLGDITNNILERDLDTNGDGTGVSDQSAAAATYFITPTVTQFYVIHEIKITIFNNALATSDNWGGIAALANGCLMRIEQVDDAVASTIRNLTPLALKTHYELARLFDVSIPFNNVDSLVVGVYKPPVPIVLNGSRRQRLVWQVRDNLAGVVRQYVTAKGLIASSY